MDERDELNLSAQNESEEEIRLDPVSDETDPCIPLEDILAEFGDAPVQQAEEAPSEEPEAPEDSEESDAPAVTGDTIEYDTEDVEQAEEAEDVEPEAEEPVYTEYDDEEFTPNPIVFQPPSRLKQLRKKLVVGPEHRYYELTELGLGKLVAAIAIMLLVLAFTCSTTFTYFSGSAPENRMRFLVFSQVFGILVSALFGCYLIMDGVGSLLRGKFSLNTMLVLTLIACSVDAYFCLETLQLPFGAPFALETLMALWAAYEKRSTEIGEMDTMRKAVRLDALAMKEEYYDGKAGILIRDGDVEEFMDNFRKPSGPKKAQSTFALISFLLSLGIGAAGYFLRGSEFAVRAVAASLLCALPATAFITLSRPKAILEKRLHRIGSVLCGWHAMKTLRKKVIFPLSDTDVFPIGSVKLNGVKVWHRTIEQLIGYAASLAEVQDSSLLPIFQQLRETRNGRYYEVSEFCFYDNGGIGGIIDDEAVLMGSHAFMEEMGIEFPEGSHVENAVYLSVDHQLCAVFALTYSQNRASAKGLGTICGYRSIIPTFVGTDYMVTPSLLTQKYRMKMKRLRFVPLQVRPELKNAVPDEDAPALILTSRDNLSARAFAVTGARALCRSCRAGAALHIFAGILGLGIIAAITLLGAAELLTSANIFLYQLVWLFPALLVSEWTRVL